MNWHKNLERCPAESQAIAHHIADIADAALGVLRQAEGRKSGLRDRRADLIKARSEEADRGDGLSVEREKYWRGRLDALTPENERADRDVKKTRETWEITAALPLAVNEFLANRCPSQPKRAKPPKRMSVDDARAEITALRQQRQAVEFAPSKRIEYVAFIEQAVTDIGRDCSLRFDPRGRGHDALGLTSILRHEDVASDKLPTGLPGAGAVQLLFMVLGGPVTDALVAMIPEDGPDAMSDDDRAVMLLDIDAAILAAERAEEAAIQRAEAAGQRVLRRPDASPLAVLGVEAR